MASATCNVLNAPAEVELVTLREGGFSQYDATQLKIVGQASSQGDVVRLSPGDAPSTISALWFLEQERLGDGFQALFSFEFDAGTSDGFAFVVQDESTDDAFGNAGPSLGFGDAFPRFLAVGFDFCSDRIACTQQEIKVVTKTEEGVETEVDAVTQATLFQQGTVSVLVNYLADVGTVQVFLNNGENPVLEATGIDLSAILDDGKFSFFGFTSSNSAGVGNLDALNLNLIDFDLIQMNSGFRMFPADLAAKTVDTGQLVDFAFQLVDSCNVPLVNPPEVNASSVLATLSDINNAQNVISFDVPSFNQQGANINLRFITTANINPTEYDLEIIVDGILVQQNPLASHVVTQTPEAGGLGLLGIVLLASLIGVLVIVVAVVARGWYNYRKKLVENAEDIEYGKTKKKIDIIDQTIEYEMNPMVAPLDKLKERLAANEKTIAELKAGQQNAIDSDYTVDQLQEENRQLRAEMQEMKRKQEYEGAGKRMSANFQQRFFGKKGRREDFGEEGI